MTPRSGPSPSEWPHTTSSGEKVGGAAIIVQLCLYVCREIVKGSHLRPLEKKDTSGRGGFRQPWNPAVSDRGGVEGREEGEEVTLGEGGAEMSLQSFMREWRRLAAQPQDQYRCV